MLGCACRVGRHVRNNGVPPEALGGWQRKHLVLVRGRLGLALRCVAPALCDVVNPTGRRPGGSLGPRPVWFEALRSHERTFDLHDCLPLRIRRLGAASTGYHVVHRLVYEMARHLQSTSRIHLQKMALFLDRLVGLHAEEPGAGSDTHTHGA